MPVRANNWANQIRSRITGRCSVIRTVVSNHPVPCLHKTCLKKPTGVLFGLQAAPLVRKSRDPNGVNWERLFFAEEMERAQNCAFHFEPADRELLRTGQEVLVQIRSFL